MEETHSPPSLSTAREQFNIAELEIFEEVYSAPVDSAGNQHHGRLQQRFVRHAVPRKGDQGQTLIGRNAPTCKVPVLSSILPSPI
jgi:hypothetical protein